jgi:nucleoside-diphosphate-sugar epimerase
LRIIVTGCTGWLGTRFLEYLSQDLYGSDITKKWKVRCLCLKGEETDLLKRLIKEKAVGVLYADLTDIATLRANIQEADVIFHIAGVIHPRYLKDLYNINALGTENLLQVASEKRIRRFIYISSNSVSGFNRGRQLMLEADPPNPYLGYGLSKYIAECHIRRYAEINNMETVILRPCWFYGPFQPIRQTQFFKMIQQGCPIIFGNGLNVRSLSYLDNIIQAMILAATKREAVGQTYWIADARAYTVLEIYRTIAELLNVKKFRPRHIPSFLSKSCRVIDKNLQYLGFYQAKIHVAGEMDRTIACSIEKAKNELGYEPAVQLKEGMRISIDWCRRNKLLN